MRNKNNSTINKHSFDSLKNMENKSKTLVNCNQILTLNEKSEFLDNLVKQKVPSQYQTKQSLILETLSYLQKHNNNHLSRDCIKLAANKLDMNIYNVYEVATFYTMFNLSPMPKFHIKVCTTAPCSFLGGVEIFEQLKVDLNIRDKKIDEITCLGNCVCAPVVQINEKNIYNAKIKNIIEYCT